MGFIEQSKQVFRKLSVFYLFFGVMAIFLIVFFFRIIPANTAEINSRAQRALNQQAANFLAKDKEMASLFRRPVNSSTPIADWNNAIIARTRDANFGNLDADLPYKAKAISLSRGDTTADYETTFLAMHDNQWQWVYKGNSTAVSKGWQAAEVTIRLSDFIRPLLASRSDIFNTYLLLLDSPATGQKRNLPLVYSQDPITGSYMLYTDTLNALQKNSDGSVAADMQVSGETYKIFYRPFSLHGQKLLLAGLLGMDDYKQRTRQTLVEYIPVCVIAILIVLIALPLIKIFMITPKEPVTYKDMALTGASFYLGPVAGCLIIFYLVLHIVNGLTFSYRLEKISHKLQQSVERNIDAAWHRLMAYDSIPFDDTAIAYLVKPVDSSAAMAKLDSSMAVHADRHTKRVFWIDAAGNTLGKWNPFDFIAPNTSVAGYAFFQQFAEQLPPGANEHSLFHTVYAGKSNSTGEFQVYVTRPSFRSFADKKAYAIVEAMDLDISKFPVLPPGFGFSLVDRDGTVLVDCDPLRNLSENILDESGRNGALVGGLQGNSPGVDFELALHGNSYLATVKPIHGQPLSLVVHYDQKFLSENIIRLLLFAIQTAAWLALTIAVCLFFSTVKNSEPNRLLFQLKPIEWIRPIVRNENSYGFTFHYFFGLIAAYSIFWFFSVLYNQDLRPLYYVALLLPFYSVWGFVVSRNKYGLPLHAQNHWKNVYRLGWVPVIFVAAVNLLVVFFIRRTGFYAGIVVEVVCFQLIAFALLCGLTVYYSRSYFSKAFLRIREIQYKSSLLLSVFVVSILPAAGILTYGYQAEKLQYKKEKLLGYAQAMRQHENYVRNDLSVGYKEKVLSILGNTVYQQDLFLTDKDLIDTIAPVSEIGGAKKAGMPDALYAGLVNRIALSGGADKSFLAIGQTSLDTGWRFSFHQHEYTGTPHLQLDYRTGTMGNNIPAVYGLTRMQNIVMDFFQLPIAFRFGCLLMVAAFFAGGVLLVKASVDRLFLQNCFNKNSINIDADWIYQIFKEHPGKDSFLKGCTTPRPASEVAFAREFDIDQLADQAFSRQDYILAMSTAFDNAYALIWKRLSEPEKYVLYDFCQDYYTNYKNAGIFISLIQKGIITERRDENNSVTADGSSNDQRHGEWEIFSLSFRQYVLSLQDTPEIGKLLEHYRVGGTWETFRIAALSLVAVAGVMIVATQSELSHKLLAVLTSVTALFPLIVKTFQIGSGDKPAG